jgi:6-pyruvoyltetrahydropterin/6-carboxytetrahydropterin synthase
VRITRTFEFDAAHRLPEHEGKCRRLHGHRYTIDVTVRGPVQREGSEHGMVRDFGNLDQWLDAIKIRFDHRTMLWDQDPLHDVIGSFDQDSLVSLDFVPTAENLAAYVATYLIERADVEIVEVTVHETPRGSATWML